jgi:hypothetical protein
MLGLRGRVVALSACVVGLAAVGSAPAAADAIALIPDRAWADYDSQSNRLSVEDLACNSARVYGNWKWTGFPSKIRGLADPHECDDRDETKVLHPPRRATGIKIRVCEDNSGPNTCTDWVRTDK